jgi:hypothetical protein
MERVFVFNNNADINRNFLNLGYRDTAINDKARGGMIVWQTSANDKPRAYGCPFGVEFFVRIVKWALPVSAESQSIGWGFASVNYFPVEGHLSSNRVTKIGNFFKTNISPVFKDKRLKAQRVSCLLICDKECILSVLDNGIERVLRPLKIKCLDSHAIGPDRCPGLVGGILRRFYRVEGKHHRNADQYPLRYAPPVAPSLKDDDLERLFSVGGLFSSVRVVFWDSGFLSPLEMGSSMSISPNFIGGFSLCY